MRTFLKKVALVLSLVIVSPFILIDRIEKFLSNSEHAFFFMGNCLALLPGLPGSCLRAAYYSATLEDASPEVHIGFGSIFCRRDAGIGRYCSIGMFCIFGCVRIGPEVMIANRVSIPSGKRQHLEENAEIIHSTHRSTIKIGNNCWIGESAIIMADIGEGAIIGAATVVTTEICPRAIAVGNPARIIRLLRDNEIEG